jgi:hypothetical protein
MVIVAVILGIVIPLMALAFGEGASASASSVRMPPTSKTKPAPSAPSPTNKQDAELLIEKAWQMAKASGCSRVMPNDPVVINLNPSKEKAKASPFIVRGMWPGTFKVIYTNEVIDDTYSYLRVEGSMRGFESYWIGNGQTGTIFTSPNSDQDDCFSLFWVGKERPDKNLQVTVLRQDGPAALILAYKNVKPKQPVGITIPVKTATVNPRIDSNVYIIATGADDTPLHNEKGGLNVRLDTRNSPLEYRSNPVWQGSTKALAGSPVLMFDHNYQRPITAYVVVVPIVH